METIPADSAIKIITRTYIDREAIREKYNSFHAAFSYANGVGLGYRIGEVRGFMPWAEIVRVIWHESEPI